jgi:uncharacterized protein YecE (DUF72 family)
VAGAALKTFRIGTAGWALPKALRVGQTAGKSVLEQYALRFDAVEINSSFYRPHRRSTYERWRASVPESFLFAVKLPRTITHELGLVHCHSEMSAFMQSVSGLEPKLAALLVQLPPSRAFDARIARAFFKALRRETSAQLVCEARSPSWFVKEASVVLEEYRITRVVADPVPLGCEFIPPAHTAFTYLRLHGSPKMYYSAYSLGYLQRVAAAAAAETWCIFDNTAAGEAWPDATSLQRLVSE